MRFSVPASETEVRDFFGDAKDGVRSTVLVFTAWADDSLP